MFIDEWFRDGFYKKLPLGYHNDANFCFGQVFWTHAYYPHENLELWRPVMDPAEPTKTVASQFRITTAGQDAFKRTLPLHVPRLETNEEFIVVRAKIRPVILIQTELPLAGVDNRGYRGKIQRRRTLVAQVFGLADSVTREPQFSPAFVDRVRKMEFPQLMFLPEKPGVIRCGQHASARRGPVCLRAASGGEAVLSRRRGGHHTPAPTGFPSDGERAERIHGAARVPDE